MAETASVLLLRGVAPTMGGKVDDERVDVGGAGSIVEKSGHIRTGEGRKTRWRERRGWSRG